MDVKIYKNPDGEALFATFDTSINGNGQRAKHYVFRQGSGFTHCVHFLIPKDEVPEDSIGRDVSERVFFGKMRLVELVENHLPETWIAIGEIVKMANVDLTMWIK